MSLCKILGKHKLIYVTKEDQEKPCSIKVAELDSRFEEEGIITSSGELNWGCPCVGNMASGPCGFNFREAFGCYHTSKADPKGSDCLGKFVEMNECFIKYPNLYQFGEDLSQMNKELK